MSILHAETLRIWTGDTRDTRPNSDTSGAESLRSRPLNPVQAPLKVGTGVVPFVALAWS
jgi:hypothetical protein